MRGHLTEKADVFGFGVVALEILCGRQNTDTGLDPERVYLLEWVGKAQQLIHPCYLSCVVNCCNDDVSGLESV